MDEKKLFENFQLTFGRMISPFEIEDIQKWIHQDNMPIDVVNLALREAVENNKINWKYNKKFWWSGIKLEIRRLRRSKRGCRDLRIAKNNDMQLSQMFLAGQIQTTKARHTMI
nr:DnaD domain protein [Streptococcus equi]